MAIFMTFDPEKTLSRHVGGLAPPETARLGVAICAALIEAVGAEGFHGGVRPDNICYDGESAVLGEPYVHGEGEVTPEVLEFIAPELFWSGQRGPAADVYSIGLLLYAILNAGRLPFLPEEGNITPNDRARAMKRRVKGEDIPQPKDNRAGELTEVVLRAVNVRPEERWVSVGELRAALASCNVEYAASDSVEDADAMLFAQPGRDFTEMEMLMAEIIVSSAMTSPAASTDPEAAAAPEIEHVSDSEATVTAPEPEATVSADTGNATDTGDDSPIPAILPFIPKEDIPQPADGQTRRFEPVMGSTEKDKPSKSRKPPAPIPPRKPPNYKDARSRRMRTNLLLALVLLAAVIVIVVFVLQNFATPSGEPEGTPSPSVPGAQTSETPKPTTTPTPTPTRLPTPSLEPPSPSPETSAVPDIKYELYVENVSWDKAKERAAELGGHLATISNSEEFAEVLKILDGTSARFVWLGGQRGADGAWVWENDESIDYFKWHSGEPSYIDTDGTPENCLMLWKGVSAAGTDWTYNDMRSNPIALYPGIFGGVTAFIVEYE